jgi:16S rRNA (guanine527-N7)-methyltransferase
VNDVGSGAGLPGVVIAILDPAADVRCVDAVGKKVAFVQQVAGELALRNLRAVHARVEAVHEQADVVASRAFAPLDRFVAGTRHLLAPGGVWMAMKGRRPEAELRALPGSIEVFHVEPLHVPDLGEERCLVWMRPRDG